MSQSKGGILVLTDPQYSSYLHQKDEVQRLNLHSDDQIVGRKAESEAGEQADDLIERETAHQVGSILKKLGLAEVTKGEKSGYQPTGVPKHKFSSHQELKASIGRLTERKRQISCLPLLPKPQTHRRIHTTKEQTESHQHVSVLIKDSDLVRELHYSGSEKDSGLSVTRADFDPKSSYEVGRLDRLLHSSPKLLPSKRTLSKYLLEVKSVEGALKSTASTDDVASSVQPSPKPRPSHRVRRSCKSKPVSAKAEEPRSSSSHPHKPMKVLSEEQKHAKALEDIREIATKNTSETGSGLGDLMRISFKCEPERAFEHLPSTQLLSRKHLNSRVYSMLSNDPSELYRIITTPSYSDTILRKKYVLKAEEWSKEHESAFKSMMRKSHSVNSLAKTRRFRELERNLPPSRTTVDKEWKYDEHSPWVNDLDFHGEDYYTFDIDGKTPKKHKHISNIRLSGGIDEAEELDPDSVIEQERMAVTGITRPVSQYTLQASAERVLQLRRFEDAKKGYEMIYKWQKSQQTLERDSAGLATHIIKDLYGDMKQMTKARYSYLSAKIARQRAKGTLSRKVLQSAEEKRVELRRKQVEFQREVGKARVVIRRIYGNAYLKPHHRVLENTSHALGSPLFYESMVKLGFLPKAWEPQPHRMAPNTVKVIKPEAKSLSAASKQHLSRFNSQETAKTPRENSNFQREKRRVTAAIAIQSWYRAAVTRRRTAKYRKAVITIQKWYKRRLRLSALLLYLLKAFAKTQKRSLYLTLLYQKDSYMFKRIVKKHPALGSAFQLFSVSQRASSRRPTFQQRKSNFSPSYDDMKELQALAAPLIQAKHDVVITERPKDLRKQRTIESEVAPMSPAVQLSDTGTVTWGKPAQASEETILLLRRLNTLREAVVQTRAEMWKMYLCAVAGRQVADSELAKLLAKDSLYARKLVGNGVERLSWEGSEVRLDLGGPLTQRDLKDMSVYTVRPRQLLDVLNEELQKAQNSRDLARNRLLDSQFVLSGVQSDLIQTPNLVLDELLVPPTLPSDSHSVLQALLQAKTSQIHSLKSQIEELTRAPPLSIGEKIAEIDNTIAHSPTLQLFK